MAELTDDYRTLLEALLPPGPAWNPDEPLFAALAPTLARCHSRALDLLEEGDPRTSGELFARWEAISGLPDKCITVADMTLIQRRADLMARLLFVGSLSRQFYIELAASLGFTITIDEFEPYRVEEPIEQPLLGEEWYFTWQINSASVGAEEPFRVESSAVEEPLVSWSVNTVLECLINRLKPSHTYVLFAYV
ncbi:MAG: putative phage tail protein [Pseudomonadota bacterium]